MRSLILVVDDDALVRETIAGLLDPQLYDLEFAVDGLDGLRRAQALRPDLILLDVMMPELDGYEVCRRLRADPQLAEVPIFIVTALDDRASRLTGLRAGADDFLAKPFDSVELQTRLQTVTRLNRYRRLLAERARFEWLVEHATDGLLVLDPQNHIQYANPQARAYLGLPAGGLDQPFLEAARRQYRCEPEAVWVRWAQRQPVPGPAYLVRAETATARSFWLLAEFLEPGSAADGRLVRLRDVTELLHSEHEMRLFHGAIMHKLHTPLVPIVGGLELIRGMAGQLPPEEVLGMVEMALAGARRLQAEIDDILSYVRALTLAQPGERLRVADLPGRLQARAAEAGVTQLTVTLAPEVASAWLPLSPAVLDAVMWELFENARKFHPRGAPAVTVSVVPAGPGWLRLRCQDDGATLSPEQLQWAWQPYLQGEKSFTGETPGMGLGLPQVARLVWQAGGRARLLNREAGSGVVVELELPLAAGGEAD